MSLSNCLHIQWGHLISPDCAHEKQMKSEAKAEHANYNRGYFKIEDRYSSVNPLQLSFTGTFTLLLGLCQTQESEKLLDSQLQLSNDTLNM